MYSGRTDWTAVFFLQIFNAQQYFYFFIILIYQWHINNAAWSTSTDCCFSTVFFWFNSKTSTDDIIAIPGVLERGDEEVGGQRVHDHGARLRGEAAGQGGVGAVPAHEPLHGRRGTLRGGTIVPLFVYTAVPFYVRQQYGLLVGGAIIHSFVCPFLCFNSSMMSSWRCDNTLVFV